MESKKLKAKDLINVGIYTAIYIVIFFAVGMLNAIPVLYPLLYILIPLISGILDLCQYFEHKKLKGYADFFNSSSSFCCGVI